MENLLAAQDFVTRWLYRYDDEFFGLLYDDTTNLAQSLALEVFKQGRSISLYGGKGMGKTTLAQGIIWHGLQNSQDKKFLPVLVSVTGANSVTNLRDLEDKFYRAVLNGLLLARGIGEKYDKVKNRLGKLAPWVASTAITAVGLVFPPATLAADAVKTIAQKLVKKFGLTQEEELTLSRSVDPKSAVDFMLKELEDLDINPVFVIDELDKVTKDQMLSEFFDGQQGWFQGKRTIISLSYTFGKLLQDAVITSVKRFSTVILVDGVTELSHFKSIVRRRIILGISQINSNENEVIDIADKIITDEAYEKIFNNKVPNTHLMLEATHHSMKRAVSTKSTLVLLSHATEDNEEDVVPPTNLEYAILSKLAKANMSPIDLANDLNRERSVISRSLSKMHVKDLVGKMGTGKAVQYFIKHKGETAWHLSRKH